MTHKLLMSKAPVAAGGSFNPETDITWHSLFWAEGSAFGALGLSNSDNVATWPNETAESDATEATNRPTFVASTSGLNSRPSVDFNGSNQRLTAAAWTTNPTFPTTVVTVVDLDSVAGNPRLLVSGSSVGVAISIVSSGPSWQISNTTGRTGGTPTTGGHLITGLFSDTGNEVLIVDGATVVNQNSGVNGFNGGLRMANRNSDLWMNGRLALVGVFEGDITADASYADFKSWVASHYGITIA